MLRDNSHCAMCHCTIETSQAPYCVSCSDKILDELEVDIFQFVKNEDGEVMPIDIEDGELRDLIKRYILNIYFQMNVRRLSHLN